MGTTGLSIFLFVVLIIFGILQIILFFKIWGMTTDVKEIRNALVKDSEEILPKDSSDLEGWADNVTETEKKKAILLVDELQPEQVIAKIISRNKFEIWSFKFWESERNNKNYKLIFKGSIAPKNS